MDGKSCTPPTSITHRCQMFIEDIERQIVDIGRFQEGEILCHTSCWIDEGGLICFPLCFCGQRLDLKNGDDVLTAPTFDDLVEQLEQIKIIAAFGGLDEALAACESTTYPSLS